MLRFVFDNDVFKNHIDYYRFIKAIPDPVIDSLRSRLYDKDLKDAVIDGNAKGKRRTKVYWLPKTDEFADIYRMFKEFVNQCNNNFYKFQISEITENIQYSVYNEEDQGYYDWHVDMILMANRKLSLVCQLSDPSEYEGGELQINLGTVKTLEKEKGTVIIFPSYILHRVTPVTKGVRRTLVLWVEGPAFV
jgi:PKHD-type hydroxylase